MNTPIRYKTHLLFILDTQERGVLTMHKIMTQQAIYWYPDRRIGYEIHDSGHGITDAFLSAGWEFGELRKWGW